MNDIRGDLTNASAKFLGAGEEVCILASGVCSLSALGGYELSLVVAACDGEELGERGVHIEDIEAALW